MSKKFALASIIAASAMTAHAVKPDMRSLPELTFDSTGSTCMAHSLDTIEGVGDALTYINLKDISSMVMAVSPSSADKRMIVMFMGTGQQYSTTLPTKAAGGFRHAWDVCISR